MNSVIIQNLIQLISTHTGLQIREQDKSDFCNKVTCRMKYLKVTTEEYYQILFNNRHTATCFTEKPLTNEWKELLLLLTIGETYFFRDKGQFNLLKNTLLPEIIAKKIKTSALHKDKKPCLRIWSAGCSSGEEPYSLAILVKELIPDLSQWNISILGTDINSESIAKAEQGIYDSWSFRQVNPQLQLQYFHQRKMRWQVDEQIRKMVKFRCMNLFKEPFPSQMYDIQNMDIIMCRNVFIYFNSQAIATIIEKFYHTLTTGGYLISGHTELHGQNLGQLQPKTFPESVVYHRNDLPTAPSPINEAPPILLKQSNFTKEITTIKPSPVAKTDSKSVTLIPPPTNTHSVESLKPVLYQAETFFDSGEYSKAIQAAKKVIQQLPKNFEAYYLIAQACANLGNYKQAVEYCQKALQINDLSEKPYYLLAHIAVEIGDEEQAKALFKKIIYLAPGSIGAYLEISFLYAREGDRNRAKKMLTTALDLLKNLSGDMPIESYNKIQASQLIIQIENFLKINA